ncbi:unnamed protein product, partial [Didymodactylos carnosus]
MGASCCGTKNVISSKKAKVKQKDKDKVKGKDKKVIKQIQRKELQKPTDSNVIVHPFYGKSSSLYHLDENNTKPSSKTPQELNEVLAVQNRQLREQNKFNDNTIFDNVTFTQVSQQQRKTSTISTESEIEREQLVRQRPSMFDSSHRSTMNQDIDHIQSDDNIKNVQTLNELKLSVKENNKQTSVVLFHGKYCPYSRK